MNARRKSKKLMEELRFMLKHADRKSNELIFMKCVNPRCKHCSENPIIATTAWEDLKKNDFKWYNPMAYFGKRTNKQEHFLNFYLNENFHSIHLGDDGLPMSKSVGKYPYCPN